MKKYFILFFVLTHILYVSAEKPACISSYPLDSAELEHLKSIDLPLVIVETVDGEEPTYDIAYPPQGLGGISITNATKVPGRIVMTYHNDTLYDSGEYLSKESGMTIKIRGNGSAAGTQKPGYKIKLQKKADLLRRGENKYKDKNWILVIDWNLKIMECFWVNELMGLQWTPQYEFVNLVINGEYRGWFALMESVERNVDCRLNVTKDGFICELDAYWWNEPLYIPSNYITDLHYTLKYPDAEDILPEQLTYITDELGKMETNICTKDSAMNSIDIESFASWALAQDILGQIDGNGSNMFYTKYDKSSNSKILAGNLWDFEGIEYTSNHFSTIHNLNLIKGLFDNQPSFISAYVRKWYEVEPYIFDTLINRIEVYGHSANAQAMDSSRLLRKWVYDWSDTCTVAVDVLRMKNWLEQRRIWLNEAIYLNYGQYIEHTDLYQTQTDNTTPSQNRQRYYSLLGIETNANSKGIVIYIDRNGRPHKILR